MLWFGSNDVGVKLLCEIFNPANTVCPLLWTAIAWSLFRVLQHYRIDQNLPRVFPVFLLWVQQIWIWLDRAS